MMVCAKLNSRNAIVARFREREEKLRKFTFALIYTERKEISKHKIDLSFKLINRCNLSSLD
jgi:hypothetical protein